MDIKKNEAQILSQLPKACRAVVAKKIKTGVWKPEMANRISVFAEIEYRLYQMWYQSMLNEIRELRTDPETFAYQLAEQLASKEITPLKAIRKANRRLVELKKGRHRPSRSLEVICKKAADYLANVRAYYRYAQPHIEVFDLKGLKDEVNLREGAKKREEEERLFQLQVLHHLRHKLDDCMNPALSAAEQVFPEELLPRALQVPAIYDEKIYQQQLMLVDTFISESGDFRIRLENPLLVKQHLLEYIGKSLAKGIPSVILVNAALKGQWLSKEVYELLMRSYDNLYKYGMYVVVYAKVKELYDRMGLENKKDLLPTETWVANLERRYRTK